MRNSGIRTVLKYEAVSVQLERREGRDNVMEDDGSLVESASGRKKTQGA